MKKIFITGATGFIGSYLSKSLLEKNYQVIGLDNLNDYYDVRLKENRLKELVAYDKFTMIRSDLSNKEDINYVFENYRPDVVVNLAAQAGVRYSIENPDA